MRGFFAGGTFPVDHWNLKDSITAQDISAVILVHSKTISTYLACSGKYYLKEWNYFTIKWN